jgi:hypothetical protein
VARSKNWHDASASSTGVLFQCRYALFVGLQAIAEQPELELSLEKFDDIAFERNGDSIELIQTKHHVKKAGNLSDASVDLWKTLNIWSVLARKDVDTPFRKKLLLVTTSAAAEGSAASFLRARDRDESKAQQLLLATAATSRSQTNKDGYDAFKQLSEAQQLFLLRCITVLDCSPNIIDVSNEIRQELLHAVARAHTDKFVERLEGWWFGVCVRLLSTGGSIPVIAIDNRLDELREEFRRAALPVDFQSAIPSANVVADLDKRPFVRQLRRIDIGNGRIEYAIRDYYRASEQRGKWAREQLLVDGEIENYERELVEAWQPRYEAMIEELPKPCNAQQKIRSGQNLFKWVEMEASFPLRTVQHRFLTHGSFHILANRYVLGWHPEYEADAKSGEQAPPEKKKVKRVKRGGR